MLQIDNRTKLLRIFFNDPLTSFHLRELSRKAKIAPPSVKRYLRELINAGLVIIEKDRIYKAPIYRGNRDHPQFLFYKKLDNLRRIYDSELLTYLHDSCLPDVIIFYGSGHRGEDTTESDIDLFLQAKEKKLTLESYEQRIGRKIHLFFSESLMSINPFLKNNILNGTVLHGYLDVEELCSVSSRSKKIRTKQRQSLKQST
jgi:predicted nucleotidyltransferase